MITRCYSPDARARQAARMLRDADDTYAIEQHAFAALRRDGWVVEITATGWQARLPTDQERGDKLAETITIMARVWIARRSAS